MYFTKERNDLLKTSKYIRFTNTSGCSLLKYYLGGIIRGRSNNTINNNIYEEYYLKNKLVSRCSLSTTADTYGWYTKGKPNKYLVSKKTKKLQDLGFLKRRYMECKYGSIVLYELGTWREKNGKRIEKFYFEKYFEPESLIKDWKKLNEMVNELYIDYKSEK